MKAFVTLLNVLFFLPVSVWLGGLAMLLLANRELQKAMPGRKTDTLAILQNIRKKALLAELVILATAWLSSILLLVLTTLLAPQRWTSADAIKIGLLLLPTITVLYEYFHLSDAIARQQGLIGDYADKDQQTDIRRKLAFLDLQARALLWVNLVSVALVLIAAVVAVA